MGLAVSSGGNVLYAVNSDFDLQWNGGTIQSYDLHTIRKHALLAMANPRDPALPLVARGDPGRCPDISASNHPGEACAPPVDSSFYVRDSATIGAFATDLQLLDGRRLFFPVRGNASLSWADVAVDDGNIAPPVDRSFYAPFQLNCGVRDGNRCDPSHEAGVNPNETGNSRRVTLPGEPFGLAFSEDAEAAVVTHQADAKSSLFLTGLRRGSATAENPSLQFIVEDLPSGGTGVAAIPHCLPQPDLSPCAPDAPRPAFLETSRAAAQVSLLRYYSDEGTAISSLKRPFLIKEAGFPLLANQSGVDSRGIAIDPTLRLACALRVPQANASATPPRTSEDVARDLANCDRIPARVFIANRSPASLVLGELGGAPQVPGAPFDLDHLTIFGSIPLSSGPSRVYIAPVVDGAGSYALRVFIVCFDSSTIYVYNPDARAVEGILRVGAGPFAMTFDPFSWNDVALRRAVPQDPRDPSLDLKKYRFAYIASFTQSYVQLLDLDDSRPNKETYQTIVFNLGVPTLPKGSF